jgi:hypothetical protein
VVVTTPGGSATDTGGFTYQAAPVVTGVAPPTGSYLGGQDVTITGTGLSDATDVTFGGVESPTVFWVGDSLVARTPPHAAGLVDVAVTTPGGTGTLANRSPISLPSAAVRDCDRWQRRGQSLAPASTGGSPITSTPSVPRRKADLRGLMLTCGAGLARSGLHLHCHRTPLPWVPDPRRRPRSPATVPDCPWGRVVVARLRETTVSAANGAPAAQPDSRLAAQQPVGVRLRWRSAAARAPD